MTAANEGQSFAGRSILVTGASSGIGRAIALDLAAHGASVLLTGRNSKRLQEVAAATGSNSSTVAVDLTSPEAPKVLSEAVADEFGVLHGLVHCAGSIALNTTQQASLHDLESQLRANLLAPYALSQRLVNPLIEGQGDIVFVNSSIVRHPRANAGQFAATQHALRGFADSLREELNPAGVRVMSLYVGRTATPRQAALAKAEERSYQPERLLQAKSVARAVAAALSLPRDAEITELSIRPMVKS